MKYNKLFKNDDSRIQPKNVTDTFENSNHGKRYTQEEFIERVESLFGKDKYDFSKMNYINFKTPIEIIEKETNKVFTVTPKYLIERGKKLQEKSN